MTTRQHLNILCKRGSIIQLVGLVPLVIGGLLAAGQQGWIAGIFAITGFALCVLGQIIRFYGRCLTCGAQLSHRLHGNAFFRIDELAHCCPYCEKPLDEDVVQH